MNTSFILLSLLVAALSSTTVTLLAVATVIIIVANIFFFNWARKMLSADPDIESDAAANSGASNAIGESTVRTSVGVPRNRSLRPRDPLAEASSSEQPFPSLAEAAGYSFAGATAAPHAGDETVAPRAASLASFEPLIPFSPGEAVKPVPVSPIMAKAATPGPIPVPTDLAVAAPPVAPVVPPPAELLSVPPVHGDEIPKSGVKLPEDAPVPLGSVREKAEPVKIEFAATDKIIEPVKAKAEPVGLSPMDSGQAASFGTGASREFSLPALNPSASIVERKAADSTPLPESSSNAPDPDDVKKAKPPKSTNPSTEQTSFTPMEESKPVSAPMGGLVLPDLVPGGNSTPERKVEPSTLTPPAKAESATNDTTASGAAATSAPTGGKRGLFMRAKQEPATAAIPAMDATAPVMEPKFPESVVIPADSPAPAEILPVKSEVLTIEPTVAAAPLTIPAAPPEVSSPLRETSLSSAPTHASTPASTPEAISHEAEPDSLDEVPATAPSAKIELVNEHKPEIIRLVVPPHLTHVAEHVEDEKPEVLQQVVHQATMQTGPEAIVPTVAPAIIPELPAATSKIESSIEDQPVVPENVLAEEPTVAKIEEAILVPAPVVENTAESKSEPVSTASTLEEDTSHLTAEKVTPPAPKKRSFFSAFQRETPAAASVPQGALSIIPPEPAATPEPFVEAPVQSALKAEEPVQLVANPGLSQVDGKHIHGAAIPEAVIEEPVKQISAEPEPAASVAKVEPESKLASDFVKPESEPEPLPTVGNAQREPELELLAPHVEAKPESQTEFSSAKIQPEHSATPVSESPKADVENQTEVAIDEKPTEQAASAAVEAHDLPFSAPEPVVVPAENTIPPTMNVTASTPVTPVEQAAFVAETEPSIKSPVASSVESVQETAAPQPVVAEPVPIKSTTSTQSAAAPAEPAPILTPRPKMTTNESTTSQGTAGRASAQLTLGFEVTSLQLTPFFKLGAVQLRPLSNIVSLHLITTEQAGNPLAAGISFQIETVDLDENSHVRSILLKPLPQAEAAATPQPKLQVDNVQVGQGSEGAPIQVTSSQGTCTAVQLLATCTIAAMDFTPAFEIGSLRLEPNSNTVLLRSAPSSRPAALDLPPSFEVANVQLEGNAQILSVRLTPSGSK